MSRGNARRRGSVPATGSSGGRLRIAEASAEAQRVDLEIRIPEEIELPLERNRMERVFSNLVGNALEMMPDGGQVLISASMQNGFVVAEVRDTGPGHRAGDPRQPVRAVRQRRQEERTGTRPGAFAADGARPRRRHVGGIRARPRRLLPLRLPVSELARAAQGEARVKAL